MKKEIIKSYPKSLIQITSKAKNPQIKTTQQNEKSSQNQTKKKSQEKQFVEPGIWGRAKITRNSIGNKKAVEFLPVLFFWRVFELAQKFVTCKEKKIGRVIEY